MSLQVDKSKHIDSYISTQTAETEKSAANTPIDFSNDQKTKETSSAQSSQKAGQESKAAQESSKAANEKEIKNVAQLKLLSNVVEELKKQGIEEPTYFDIYKFLSAKKELSDDEKVVLDSISAQIKEELKKEQAELMKFMLSDEYLQLSSNKKVDVILDKYLSKIDGKYISLSEKEKTEYLNKKKTELFKLVKPLSEKSNPALAGANVLTLLQASVTGFKSLDEISKMPKEDLKAFVSDTQKSIMKQIVSLVDSKELEGKTSREKVHIYADAFFSRFDDKYKSLKTDEEKSNYIEKKVKELFKSFGSVDIMQDDKDFVYDEISATIVICAKNNLTIDEYAKMSTIERASLQYNQYDKDGNIKGSALYKAKLGLAEKISKEKGIEADSVTEEDLHNYLKKQKNLTEEEKTLLKRYEIREKYKSNKKPGKRQVNTENINVKAKMHNLSVDEYIDKVLEKVNEKPSSEESKKTIEHIVAGAVNSEEPAKNLEKIVNKLLDLGWSASEVRKVIPTEYLKDIAAFSIANNDGAGTGKTTETLEKLGGKEFKEINDTTARIHAEPGGLDKEQSSIYGQTAIKHKRLIPLFTESENKYRSPQDASEVFKNVLTNSETSKANRALFSKSSVETAQSDEAKVYIGKELSTINDASVTEGLAAASKSIKNSSARSEYNSYVETASKNYSAEEQARINNAMKTGSISSYTLSQTEISPISSVSETSGAVSQTNETTSVSTTSVQKAYDNLNNSISKSSSDDKIKEKELANKYFNYLQDVTKKLEQKRDVTAQKLQEVKEHIEESQKPEELEEIEKVYNGISETVINKLKSAYATGGMTSLYEKLGEIGPEAQRVFLMYFIRYGTASEIRNFADKFADNLEIISMICAYGDISVLSDDLIARYFKKGVINASSINDIRNFASNHKNDIDIIRGLFEFSGMVSILGFNYDLITELLSKGKVTIAQLKAAGIYESYKNSLSPIKQQELEEKFESEKYTSVFEEDSADNLFANSSTVSPKPQEIQPAIPGSPEFYAQLNQQSDKYNPNNYFTGTTYDPKRLKKLDRRS